MKLQYLIIIFIIITIPIILLLTYYMSLQKATLDLQTSYDTRFIDSAKQAMEAFEVNTVEWDNGYSRYADSKRRDVLASINTFKTSLANSLNITGIAKENLLMYIPAVMYNLYDGYYIYSPTYVPVTKNNKNGVQLFQDGNSTRATTEAMDKDGNMNKILYVADKNGRTYSYTYTQEDGSEIVESLSGLTTVLNNAKKEYQHNLKTFVQYSEKINNTIIDYTLDNYIRVYTTNDKKEGYLIDTSKFSGINTAKINYNGIDILPEQLSENIRYIDNNTIQEGNYTYVYNTNNEKCYYDENLGGFFKIINNKRVNLVRCNIGDYNCEYKSISIVDNNYKIVKLYQPLNTYELPYIYTEDMLNNPNEVNLADLIIVFRQFELSGFYIDKDFSAVNYYTESYAFTKWVNDNINVGDFLKISSTNNTEDGNSKFNLHKQEVMKNSIINNLQLAISSYSANSTQQYNLPVFTEQDWSQILSNISMTAFIQGIPIGLKSYNNYVIAVSSNNKEYVNPNELYYVSNTDYYYHSKGCDKTAYNQRR